MTKRWKVQIVEITTRVIVREPKRARDRSSQVLFGPDAILSKPRESAKRAKLEETIQPLAIPIAPATAPYFYHYNDALNLAREMNAARNGVLAKLRWGERRRSGLASAPDKRFEARVIAINV